MLGPVRLHHVVEAHGRALISERGCAIRLEIGCSRRGIPLAEKSTTRQRRDVSVGDQMLPISLTKSSSSFLVSAYFLAISSYLDSHWSRDCSRAWTLRS